MKRWPLMAIPFISFSIFCVLFQIVFPSYGDLSEWVLEGYSMVPFLIWAVTGLVLGLLGRSLFKRWPEAVAKYGRRIVGGLVVWLLVSVLISVAVGRGGGTSERLSSSPLLQAWFVLIFALFSLAPSAFAIISILERSVWSKAGAVVSSSLLIIASLVYVQASETRIPHQSPILSLLLIWSMLFYVEGINWIKRYTDRDRLEFSSRGKDMKSVLWQRQMTYTVILGGFASAIAYLPFIFWDIVPENGSYLLSIYEMDRIFGKAVVGLLLLLPLGLLALFMNWRDRRR